MPSGNPPVDESIVYVTVDRSECILAQPPRVFLIARIYFTTFCVLRHHNRDNGSPVNYFKLH